MKARENQFSGRGCYQFSFWGRCWCLMGVSAVLLADDFQGASHLMDFELDPIRYSRAASDTAIDRLDKTIRRGALTLRFRPGTGYLNDLLDFLEISTASQVLVYAKSSAQRDHIHPGNPRAIYFNDEVYVAYIPGAPTLEVTASDRRLGTVFYTLDQRLNPTPTFERSSQCLECHAASRTMGVPGHLFRSFAVDRSGLVDFTALGSQMTHRLPISERYGGWYVSGKQAPLRHHGINLESPGSAETSRTPFPRSEYVDSGSDIVALIVLGHQVHFHNYLTRLNYEARIAMRQYGHVRYLKQQVESFVRYVLFADEVSLDGPVEGDPRFLEAFMRSARKDGLGRSLRDFDLRNRVFKYPCSYLLGSEAFASLEPTVRRAVSLRIKEILDGAEFKSPAIQLTASEREAIESILLATNRAITRFW